MRNSIICLRSVLFIGATILMLSCNSPNNSLMPDTEVRAGLAKISGKITGFNLKEGETTPEIILLVPNPVTSVSGVYRAPVGADGSFVFEVPVECSSNIGIMGSALFSPSTVSICLIAGEVAEVGINNDNAGRINVIVAGGSELTSNDMVNHFLMFINFFDARDTGRLYTMTPEEFSRFAIDNMLENRLKRSINDSLVSAKAKSLITNDCKLRYLKGCLLQYTDYIIGNYNRDYSSGKPESFTPTEPDISYYKLLKEFNLNDPQYLYSQFYPEALQTILTNETINISPINEVPVDEWLKDVKKTMTPLIGTDKGLFYDMLVANAYARQFEKELRPLSDKQKENIKNYFSNEEYVKILFRKNEEIIKLEEERNLNKPVLNTTPAVPVENLMDAIISKYKGKPVIVDFWATWCSPCMNAMEQMHELKNTFIKGDVVFVYISNPSSPAKEWEQKAKTITGEHYYLSNEEWQYVMNKFGFEGIPSYLLFDRNGILKNKTTGYPGNDNMSGMIKEML